MGVKIVVELNKNLSIGDPFTATVKFLKDGVPIEPTEKKITLRKPDGSFVDFTPSFSKINTGAYRINTTAQPPIGLRILDVHATINGSKSSICKKYRVNPILKCLKCATTLKPLKAWGWAVVFLLMGLIPLIIYLDYYWGKQPDRAYCHSCKINYVIEKNGNLRQKIWWE